MREIYIRPSWLVVVLVLLVIIIFTSDHSSKPDKYDGFIQKESLPPEKMTVDLLKFPNPEENQKCFKCHGKSKYTDENTELGKMVNERMYTELIMSPDK